MCKVTESCQKNLWADGCVDRSWWQMIPSPRKGPMWAITISVPGHSPSHRQGFLMLREMSEGSAGTEACSWGITSCSRENTSRGCCLEESGPSAWLVRRRQATVSLATRKGTRKKSSTNWSSAVTGDQKLMLRDQKEKSHSLLTGHLASQLILREQGTCGASKGRPVLLDHARTWGTRLSGTCRAKHWRSQREINLFQALGMH